ncbi:MAG: hypothetical protein ACQEQU_09390 [Spirochaetota bacterium]
MFGFFLKKAFFDGWDNLIALILLNVLSVGMIALGYGALQLIEVHLYLTLIAALIWFFALHLFIGGVSFFTKEFAFYKRPSSSEFREALRASVKPAMLLAVVNLFLLLMLLFVIPFYFRMGNMVGTIIGALLVWIFIIGALSLIYFLPVCAQLGDRPFKALKKAFIIALDNPGTTLLLAIYTLLLFLLSIVTAMLVPGIGGIVLAHQDATKLLMYKYDYLQEEGEDKEKRRHIPWSALLFDEKEMVGSRTLKGMIFPWKE